MRCGDSCYSDYRAMSFHSVQNTLVDALRLLRQISPEMAVPHLDPATGKMKGGIALHLFSQKPHNNSAENHFQPLLHYLRAHANLTTYDESDPSNVGGGAHPHALEHQGLQHAAPPHHERHPHGRTILLQLGGWPFLLHYGLTIGPLHSCQNNVPYKKDSGWFDTEAFTQVWLSLQQPEFRAQLPRFDSHADCESIQVEERARHQRGHRLAAPEVRGQND